MTYEQNLEGYVRFVLAEVGGNASYMYMCVFQKNLSLWGRVKKIASILGPLQGINICSVVFGGRTGQGSLRRDVTTNLQEVASVG